MSKTLFKVFNKVDDGDGAEIHLRGSIRKPIEEEGETLEDTISYNRVEKELNKLKNVDEILIFISSKGGDLFEGLEIRNLLIRRSQNQKIITINTGTCASAGSIVYLGGSETRAYKNSLLMVHCSQTVGFGNKEYFKKLVKQLEDIDDALLENYTSRFTGTRSELKELLEEETFLKSYRAKRLGFVDKVIEDNNSTKTTTNSTSKSFNNRMVVNRSPKANRFIAQLMDKYEDKPQNKNLFSNFKK